MVMRIMRLLAQPPPSPYRAAGSQGLHARVQLSPSRSNPRHAPPPLAAADATDAAAAAHAGAGHVAQPQLRQHRLHRCLHLHWVRALQPAGGGRVAGWQGYWVWVQGRASLCCQAAEARQLYHEPQGQSKAAPEHSRVAHALLHRERGQQRVVLRNVRNLVEAQGSGGGEGR